MSSVVAIVKSIVGQVIAVSPEGARRVLIEGDRLLAGEQVLTGLAGAVTLELADGRSLDLGRGSQWNADAPDSSTDLAAATAQAAPSVAELQQAIAAGADPSTELEATAAGPSSTGAGGADEGGHSFVMLDATAGSVDPTIGFPTGPLNFAMEGAPVELGAPGNHSGVESPGVGGPNEGTGSLPDNGNGTPPDTGTGTPPDTGTVTPPDNGTGTPPGNGSGPTASRDSAAVLESAKAVGSDVVLVLDRSGSMGPANNNENGSDPDGPGGYASRIEMLKDAVTNLFASGTVHSVFIVSFSSYATFHDSGKDGGWFTNLEDALAAINKLEAGGNTDYADALNTVMRHFTPPPPGGGKLVNIFISDGLPNQAPVPESKWIDFLEKNNFDESIAAGFGGLSESDKDFLEPIAWTPGEKPESITDGNQDDHVLVVDTTLTSLTDMLISSTSGSVVSGNVTSNDTGGAAGWAADGWKLVSVEFNSQVYTFTSASDIKTIDLGNLGTLIIKADGSYTFTGKGNYDTATSLHGVVNYTVKDANGATASSSLNLTVNDRSNPIANDDNVTATLTSKIQDVPTEWRFAPFVVKDSAALASGDTVHANTNSWQSTALVGKTLDAQFSDYVLVMTDNNGENNDSALALTPVYRTGEAADSTLTFSTTVSHFNPGDSAGWALYESTDGGLSWHITQRGSIDATTTKVTISALNANAEYRILLDVNDKSAGDNASVTFGDFMVNTPGGPVIEWSAAPFHGSVTPNDVWGSHGETSTLSVKVNGTWMDIPASGTTITGDYGSLVIKPDGSYVYTPTNNKNNVGHTDKFEYKLTQADGDTDSAHLNITINATGPGAGAAKAAAFSLLGGEDQDIVFTQSDTHTLYGGHGNDLLIGTNNTDTFVWKAGDTGNDVLKGFKPDQGDRLDLSELLQGEKGSTLDNFLKITTVNGESTLQVSAEGKLNDAGGLSNADVTIKLEGVNWANTTINSLVSGADPMIKIDHANS